LVLEFYSYFEYPNLQKTIKNQRFSIWIKSYRSSSQNMKNTKNPSSNPLQTDDGAFKFGGFLEVLYFLFSTD
jgi:hypothetical protein